jgi:uncharacterized protein (DUF169 family)
MLKLKTHIVGIQWFEKVEDMERIEKIRRPDCKQVFCQVITQARTIGWTLGVTLDNVINNTFCLAMLGLYERPKWMRDGTYKGPIWWERAEDAKKYEDSMPVIPSGKFNAVAIGPVFSEKITPDIVLVYGNPGQMILLVNGLQWKNYERFTFYCVGESSCADAIAQCYLSKKPSLALPCFGERRFANTQDDEMVIAIPSNRLGDAAEGLENLSKRGIRYPIPPAGIQLDPGELMPEHFKKFHSLKWQL